MLGLQVCIGHFALGQVSASFSVAVVESGALADHESAISALNAVDNEVLGTRSVSHKIAIAGNPVGFAALAQGSVSQQYNTTIIDTESLTGSLNVGAFEFFSPPPIFI